MISQEVFGWVVFSPVHQFVSPKNNGDPGPGRIWWNEQIVATCFLAKKVFNGFK